jgi:hypothetical protein
VQKPQIPVLNKSLLINFLVPKYPFQSIFPPRKEFPEETLPKIYLGQDSDPDVFKKAGSGQKSSGSATLVLSV